MINAPAVCPARIDGNLPPLCCGSNQHFTGAGAGLAHRLVSQQYTQAAAGKLRFERRRKRCLLHCDLVPRYIEFFGEEHGQHSARSLADVRIFCEEHHAMNRINTNQRRQRRDDAITTGLCKRPNAGFATKAAA